MNEKIKKCPHCGATAWFEPYVDHDNEEDLIGIYIECNGCMCSTRRYSYTEKGEAEAIAAWNKRVDDDICNDLVKLVKWLMDGGLSDNPELSINTHDLLRKHGIDV